MACLYDAFLEWITCVHNGTQKFRVASYLQHIHLYMLLAAKMENGFPIGKKNLHTKLNILGKGLERLCFIRIVTVTHR